MSSYCRISPAVYLGSFGFLDLRCYHISDSRLRLQETNLQHDEWPAHRLRPRMMGTPAPSKSY